MRTWPAIDAEMRRLTAAADDSGQPDLFQAALTDYDVAAIDETDGSRWRVFFHTADERDRALALLAGAFPDLPLAGIDVPDEDWAARSQAELRAIQIGDIIVAPPWDIDRLKAAAPATMTIVIQPSMGFGTGHHATTRLCLAALQQIDLSNRTVLDVGTGSGVLAIAARLRGAGQVLAIDDDPDAIESARENVGLNDVQIDLEVTGIERVTHAPVDLVMANLTGGLLMHAAERLQQLVAATGRLVISGFMQTEETDVLDAFRRFSVIDRRQEDEWVCATLQRPGAFV